MFNERILNIQVTNYFEEERGLLLPNNHGLTIDEKCFIFPREIKLKYIKNALTTNKDVVIVNINRIRYSKKWGGKAGETYEEIYKKEKVRHDFFILEHIGNMVLSEGYNRVILTYNEYCLSKSEIDRNTHLYSYDKIYGWVGNWLGETSGLFIK